jgi:hypothetical protein
MLTETPTQNSLLCDWLMFSSADLSLTLEAVRHEWEISNAER